MRQVGMPLIIGWTLIFALALLLRCSGAILWQNRQADENAFAFGDSFSYWVLGHQISIGEPYQFGGANAKVSRTPGYPILIAIWHKIFAGSPSVLSVRMLNALIGALTVVAVGALATLLFDRFTGICAAILAALYPGAIVMSILILSEGPFCLFMILQLIACYFVLGRESRADLSSKRRSSWFHQWGPALLAGLSGGVAILIRPSWLLFTPAFLLVLLLFSRRRTFIARHGLVMLLALCLTMSPWWVRNYQVTGHFVPTTLQVGASLYDGLHAAATGGSDMSFVLDFHRQQNKADLRLAGASGDTYEYRLNSRLRAAALAWVRTHPLEVLKLAAIKFTRLWRPVPGTAVVESGWYRWGLGIGYLGILTLSLSGLVELGRRFKRNRHIPDPGEAISFQAPVSVAVLLSISPAIYFTALHMVFVSSIRYRQPAVLVLTLLAGVGLSQLLRRSRVIQKIGQRWALRSERGC